MFKTVNFNEFVEDFRKAGRFEQWGGYDGLQTLFSIIEDLENGLGEQIEFDVIALCCDYSYYQDINSLKSEYSFICEDLTDYEFLNKLNCNTYVVPTKNGGYIVQNF